MFAMSFQTLFVFVAVLESKGLGLLVE